MTLISKRYQLISRLGMGGMGVVYLAHDLLTGQQVALKQVTQAAASWEQVSTNRLNDLRVALAREFKVLASLRHPNIISVLDYGFDNDGLPYFTMDLLEAPLNIIDAADDHPLAVQVGLLIQTLQALAYLHRWGILHRDLKPDNVLVVNGVVKVLDFGLAQSRDQAATDDLTGTLVYIAPEVLQGQPATESADLYSVGVMGYELFAGRFPFTFNKLTSVIQDIISTPPDMDALVLEPALKAVIERLLAKSPAERYESADEVIRALSVAIGQPPPEETAAIRESFLQAARFVGRGSELSLLTEALAQAIQGQGSAWLVGGESGVGKSRLVEELRILALVQGALVVRGQAIREGGGLYNLWRDVLRRLVLVVDVSDEDAGVLKAAVPDIDDLLGRNIADALAIEPEAAQARLLGVMSGMLRRLDRPVLVILEDLQWTGTESLAILSRITQVMDDLPLMIVGNFRDDELPDLPQRLPQMRYILLQRLSPTEIRELSQSMLGANASQPEVLDLLERETEGNVFFLVEVVRALAEEAGNLEQVSVMTLPRSVFAGGVRQVVQRRLARVPLRWQVALDAAAILGRRLDLRVLGVMFPDIDWQAMLTDCASAAVLEVHDDHWRFVHDKLREGLLDRLTDIERQTLHRKAAEVIEQVYPDDHDHFLVLAYHWDRAGDVIRGAHYAGLAGQQDLSVSAYSEAVTLFEQALKPLEGELNAEDKRYKASLKHMMATAHWGLSDYVAAGQLYAESLALYEVAGDEAGMAEALKGLGDVARRRGDFIQAREYFSRCLTLCENTGDRTTIAQALARLGLVARILGDYPLAESYYKRSLELYESLNELVRIASLLSGMGLIASDQGRMDEAKAAMEKSLAIARQVHNPSGTALMLTGLSWVNYLRGAYAEAREQALESLSLSRDIGDRWSTANNLGNLGKITCELGDYPAAWDFFREGLALAQRIESLPLQVEILPGIAQWYYRQGSPDYAVMLLHVALNHPACYSEVIAQAEPLLAQLRAEIPPEQFEAAMAQAQAETLESVLAMIVNQSG